MSYYDFDDHFWTAKTVCAQSKLANSQKKPRNRTVLRILSVLSIAIVSSLLVKAFGAMENNNPDENFTETSTSSSNCLFLKGNEKMQVYCSQSK